MPKPKNDRSAKTYMQERQLRSGETVKVLRCLTCNGEMKAGVWTVNRGGIIYKSWGTRCMTEGCDNYIESHYELLGPAADAHEP